LDEPVNAHLAHRVVERQALDRPRTIAEHPPLRQLGERAMTIELDHAIVSARDKSTAAATLARLLGVPWGQARFGPFAAVYVNDGLTLDFIDTDEAFPIEHFCFRVDDATFDAILARLRAEGIDYRSDVRGPVDHAVSTQFGGRGVYWNVPEGHQWEVLTVSYARAQG
jgi:catechol 2,3-dioxygenase-like lactoylglutathione lyase family enzyme